MKKVFAALLVLAAVLTVSACAPKDASTPEAVVDSFLTQLQQGKYEEAEQWVTQNATGLLRDGLENFEVADSHFVRALQSFTYTVKSTETGDDKATVTIDAKYKNMVPVMAAVREDMAQRIIVDPSMQKKSDEEMQKFANELLSEAAKTMEQNIEIVEKEVEIGLDKTEDGWRVRVEEEGLVRMLTGNLFAPGPQQ